MKNCPILFLSKKDDEYVEKALKFLKRNFTNVQSCLGEWGDPLPERIKNWTGDYIISYSSRWVIPDYLLKQANIASINFHPAPPNYPGFGCTNFALYEDAKEYGVTCHHMVKEIDAGAIIAVKKFPVFSTDNVDTLLARTYNYQLNLFYDIIGNIISSLTLPTSQEQWTRKAFTRKDFNELIKLIPTMTREEITKIIRATNYRTWKPTIEIHGFTFELKIDGDE